MYESAPVCEMGTVKGKEIEQQISLYVKLLLRLQLTVMSPILFSALLYALNRFLLE